MADRGRGTSGWSSNSSHWSDETEIGVWDPSTANSGGGGASGDRTSMTLSDRSNYNASYNEVGQRYQDNQAVFNQSSGFGSTWGSQSMNHSDNVAYHQPQELYRHPHSGERPTVPASNPPRNQFNNARQDPTYAHIQVQGTNYQPTATQNTGYPQAVTPNSSYLPATHEYYNPNVSNPYFDSNSTQQPSYPTNRVPDVVNAGGPGTESCNTVDTWHAPITTRDGPYSHSDTRPNYREPYEELKYSNPVTFRNPLMDEKAESPEVLIERLRIQNENASKQAPSLGAPAVLSKSALAQLGKELNEAATVFKSAENLKLARDAQLGLLDGVGREVIVSDLSVNAAEFVPRREKQAPTPEKASEEEEAALIELLGTFIQNVLLEPGCFDESVTVLVQQVVSRLHSDETVKKMVEMIFDKAIHEDNFKYLGAKLCDRLTQPNVLNSFRTIFLSHFQGKYKKIQSTVEKRTDEDRKTIHGFFMFMAEVYIHIKINGAPIKALGRSLSKALESLLTSASISDVQFVCKLLKLAGSRLLDAFANSEQDMKNYEKNFECLIRFSEKAKDEQDEESKRIVLLIKSVCSLKESNWGRTLSSTRPKSSIEDPEQYGENLSLVDQNYYMNEPVFFTPEGVQYTAAEAQIPDFYEQHLAKYNISQNLPVESDDSYQWNSTECDSNDFIPSDSELELYGDDDQEYSKEYEKFLAETGQLK